MRLAPGFPSGGLDGLFQDFTVAPGERPRLREVLATLARIADPADAEGVAAFREECRQTLTGLELLDRHRASVEDRLPELGPIGYEVLAAFTDHPIYPTARCRHGLTEEELLAYAPEFAPRFTLRWAAVPTSGRGAGAGVLPVVRRRQAAARPGRDPSPVPGAPAVVAAGERRGRAAGLPAGTPHALDAHRRGLTAGPT